MKKIVFGAFALTVLASNLWAVPSNPFKARQQLSQQFDGALPVVDTKPGLVLLKRTPPKKVSEWTDTARFGCTGHAYHTDGTYAGPGWCSYDKPRKIETFEETLTWQVANQNAFVNYETRKGQKKGMVIGGVVGALTGLGYIGILALAGAMPLAAYVVSTLFLGIIGALIGRELGNERAALRARDKADQVIFTEKRSFTVEHPL